VDLSFRHFQSFKYMYMYIILKMFYRHNFLYILINCPSSMSELTLGKLFSITVIANHLLKRKGTTLSVSSWESFSKWHKLAKILKTCMLNLLLIFKWWLMSSIFLGLVQALQLWSWKCFQPVSILATFTL
jgi:hypothetical protein